MYQQNQNYLTNQRHHHPSQYSEQLISDIEQFQHRQPYSTYSYPNYPQLYDTNNQQHPQYLQQKQYSSADEQKPELELQDEQNIFNTNGHKLSPIINNNSTYLLSKNIDNDNTQKNQNHLINNQRQPPIPNRNNSRWKNFVNPDVNRYYAEIISKQFKNQIRKQDSQLKSKEASRSSVRAEKDNQENKEKYKEKYQEKQLEDNEDEEGQIHFKTPPQRRFIKRIKNDQEEPNKEKKVERKCERRSERRSQRHTQQDKPQPQPQQPPPQKQSISQQHYHQMKQKYQDKISVLQHQNSNLKDQLFYLRAAILSKYEKNTQEDSDNKIQKQ